MLSPSRIVRLLVVDDSADDADLIAYELRTAGWRVELRRVQTLDEVRETVTPGRFDLALIDYHLPRLTAPDVFARLRELDPELPGIVISGVFDEQIAGEVFRAGARDVILKSRLARLGPAIARELEEAGERRRRRAAEAALHESEQRYRILLETAPDGFVTLDADGRIAQVNPAAERILATSREELLGRPWAHCLRGAPGAPHEGASAPPPTPGTSDGTGEEVTLLCPDGTRRVVEVSRADWRQGGAPFTTLMLRDATQRRALEAQLRQAQRLECVGQLAGGVAHDFNNVLGIIMSYATMLGATLPGGDPRREDVDQVLDACRRGGSIVRQLLTFSQRKLVRRTVVRLSDLVLDLEKLVRPLLGETISWHLDLEPVAPIVADTGQLEQVCLNLAINARDAMPDGGRLTLRTREVVLDAPTTTATGTLAPGAYVRLDVEDEGLGIAPEHMPRLFEPFFTTKAPGKGTGLGLPTVYGIVRQAGGEIDVRTEVGRGTTFSTFFPRASDPQVSASDRPPPLRSGKEPGIIVLVEDDAAARTAMRLLLEASGRTVESFGDASAALRFLREHHERTSHVIADMVLPGLSGADLMKRVTERWPTVVCVMMSGYAAGQMDIPEHIPVLEKPVDPAVLMAYL